jgi:hypothetical protein
MFALSVRGRGPLEFDGGEEPLYIARRLVRFASEDVGLADPDALTMAVSVYQACHFLGMPECDVHLTHAVVYLAMAPGQYLELFTDGSRDGLKGPDVVGVCHLCLMTKDIHKSYDAVRQAGGPIDREIQRGKSQCWMFWTHDPDGNSLEIMEIVPNSLQAQANARFETEN